MINLEINIRDLKEWADSLGHTINERLTTWGDLADPCIVAALENDHKCLLKAIEHLEKYKKLLESYKKVGEQGLAYYDKELLNE